MNENDLGQLVNLLSYLKKHDDVESELSKRKEPPAGHAAGRRKPAAVTDETQRTLLERLGSTQLEGLTDPAVLQARRDAKTSIGSGTPGSESETSEEPETSGELEGTENEQGIIAPYKEYGPRGDEFGPRGGQFRRLGDTPIESVTAPEIGSETSDDESQILDLIRSSGYSLDEVKQAFDRINRSREDSLMKTKSSESILLSLLSRLNI